MKPNPDIVCLQELPPNYAWNAEDGDFNVFRKRDLVCWIRICSGELGENTYRLREFGEWLSEPYDSLQALVDVTAVKLWLGCLK